MIRRVRTGSLEFQSARCAARTVPTHEHAHVYDLFVGVKGVLEIRYAAPGLYTVDCRLHRRIVVHDTFFATRPTLFERETCNVFNRDDSYELHTAPLRKNQQWGVSRTRTKINGSITQRFYVLR